MKQPTTILRKQTLKVIEALQESPAPRVIYLRKLLLTEKACQRLTGFRRRSIWYGQVNDYVAKLGQSSRREARPVYSRW